MSCTPLEAVDIMCSLVANTFDPIGIPVIYPNTASGADVGDAPSAPVWVRVIIQHADGFQSSLTGAKGGMTRYTKKGILSVQVMGVLGDGSKAAYDAAQSIEIAVRKAKGIPVWFRRPRIIEAGNFGSHDRIDFLAEFQYDDVR